MKRHLNVILVVASVFVFFMAQAQANEVGVFLTKPSLSTMILNRCINIITDAVSWMPPTIEFRLQDIGFGAIENIKQIEQSV